MKLIYPLLALTTLTGCIAPDYYEYGGYSGNSQVYYDTTPQTVYVTPPPAHQPPQRVYITPPPRPPAAPAHGKSKHHDSYRHTGKSDHKSVKPPRRDNKSDNKSLHNKKPNVKTDNKSTQSKKPNVKTDKKTNQPSPQHVRQNNRSNQKPQPPRGNTPPGSRSDNGKRR